LGFAADQRALAQVLFEHFSRAGFDYTAARAIEPRRHSWPRPPLFTRLELGGEPLQRYLAVAAPHSADDLVDVYERFIAGYLYSRAEGRLERKVLPSGKYLRRELSIPFYPGRMLFADPGANRLRLDTHLNLVQFAALAAYNHGCHLEHGPDTFVAITVPDARVFGVRAGRLVSNLRKPRREIPVRFLSNPEGNLVDLPRPALERSAAASAYDVLRQWLERNSERLGERGEALLLAVSILRWHRPSFPPTALGHLFGYERSGDALRAACESARGYDRFDEPLKQLKEIFTPLFASVSDFHELFGNPSQKLSKPLSANTRLKWDQAINSLDPAAQQ
jgi:hypothetical protein